MAKTLSRHRILTGRQMGSTGRATGSSIGSGVVMLFHPAVSARRWPGPTRAARHSVRVAYSNGSRRPRPAAPALRNSRLDHRGRKPSPLPALSRASARTFGRTGPPHRAFVPAERVSCPGRMMSRDWRLRSARRERAIDRIVSSARGGSRQQPSSWRDRPAFAKARIPGPRFSTSRYTSKPLTYCLAAGLGPTKADVPLTTFPQLRQLHSSRRPPQTPPHGVIRADLSPPDTPLVALGHGHRPTSPAETPSSGFFHPLANIEHSPPPEPGSRGRVPITGPSATCQPRGATTTIQTRVGVASFGVP